MIQEMIIAMSALAAVGTTAPAVNGQTDIHKLYQQAKAESFVIGDNNLNSIFEKLDKLGIKWDAYIFSNCPGFEIPGFPDTPDTELPDTETPESPELPDTETPGPETPDLPDSDTGNGETTEKSFAEQVVDLVNIERTKAGLSPLTINKTVESAALVRAREIETSFSHTRPDGTSFTSVLKEHGVSYMRAGENIAWGQKTPEIVVNGWMNSPSHRANILNASFKTIGVGHYQNAKGVNYWTQLFTN